MSIKWQEKDVIEAMNKALNPPTNGTGRANLLQQLKARTTASPELEAGLSEQPPRR